MIMCLLSNETGFNKSLLGNLFYVHVISFEVIFIGNYTQLYRSLPAFEVSLEACHSSSSNSTNYTNKCTFVKL